MSGRRVAEILGQPSIETVQRPIASARALPPAAYTDPAFFALERELVFRRHWISVAFAHEIPDPGDYVVRRVLADSFIVARDEAGAVLSWLLATSMATTNSIWLQPLNLPAAC